MHLFEERDMEAMDERIVKVSRSFNAVPPKGGRVNISQESQKRFERGNVPAPIQTGNGAFGEEVWSMKAKRVAKRDRAKKERQRWDDSEY